MLERILNWYTRLFVVWVILFGALSYRFHEAVQPLSDYMMWFFALTMFGIGAVLTLDDFKRIGRQPWVILLGVTAQFTIMPLGAFVLARLFRLPPMLALGLILAGCAPGAMASNMICYIARADVAYSVSLTAVATLICPVLTPALTKLLAEHSGFQIPAGKMFIDLILTVILPLLLGLGLNTAFPDRMKRFVKVFPAISVTFIVFICSVVLARHHDRWREITPVILLVVAILNLYGMSCGFGVGRLFGLGAARERTLTIEIGMQNAGLGAVLANNHFADHPEVAAPPVVFVFFCIFSASLLISRWSGRPAGAPESVPRTRTVEVVTPRDRPG